MAAQEKAEQEKKRRLTELINEQPDGAQNDGNSENDKSEIKEASAQKKWFEDELIQICKKMKISSERFPLCLNLF